MVAKPMTSVVRMLCRTLSRSVFSEVSDAQLLESFIACNDKVALEELVHRHAPMVMGVCRRLLNHQADAEDAFQATFMLLVRKASSIVKRDKVSGWLYTVACKICSRSREMASRRRETESQVSLLPEPSVSDQQDWKDIGRVLDHELSQLPDKYRDPIILCHLEGKSIKEAAEQLQCPIGTLASRLNRGREQLSKGLARHGVAVSAAALAMMLPRHASAAVSSTSITAAVDAAASVVAGSTAAAAGATKAAILMNAMLQRMLLAKLKVPGILLLLVLVLAASAGFYADSATSSSSNSLATKGPAADRNKRLDQPDRPGPQVQRDTPPPPQAAAAPIRDKENMGLPAPGGRLVARAAIPGTATDLSRQDYGVGSNFNQFGGISSIAYTGKDDTYLVVADRGPQDGQTDYLCRFHTMKITLTGNTLTTSLQATTILRDKKARPFVGNRTALESTDLLGGRFDPEGICLGARGTIFVSDEFGPSINEFDLRGNLVKRLPVPARFKAAKRDADPARELKLNKKGRSPNIGFEGVAITPDGRKLIAAMERPLLQDGGNQGCSVRLLEFDLATSKTREFLYPLRKAGAGLASLGEIVAINNHEFLTLERGTPRNRFCKVYKIDLKGATDIQRLDSLPKAGIPSGVKSVKKTLLLDLSDPRFGLPTGEVPVRVEGLTLGPVLPDGSRLMLLVNDNSYAKTESTEFFAFALDAHELRFVSKLSKR